MDNIQKIMNVMEQIEYGFLDNNGNNICDNTESCILYIMADE